ncbi:hypothetical protein ACRAWD_06000 [Caulobacter segnis]
MGPGLELLVLGMNGLFLGNTVAYQLIHFEPAKLVYFVLMSVAFATSAPSRRVALVSVGTAMAGLGWMAGGAPGDPIAQYMFIGLAGAFASLAHVGPDARRRRPRGARAPGQRGPERRAGARTGRETAG